MSRYTATSDVGRANRLAAQDAVEVSPATAAVLEAAIGWAIASDGAFDPCMGRAVELWDVEHRSAPPAEAAVRRLAARRLYRALDLAPGPRPRVRLTDRDAAIDLGGIAKGYGVDRAVDALRRHGITRGFVNVGGDLHAIGPPRTAIRGAWGSALPAPGWPDGDDRVADAAIATSGDYERFFDYAAVAITICSIRRPRRRGVGDAQRDGRAASCLAPMRRHGRSGATGRSRATAALGGAGPVGGEG
jgi:thiamine biosynthesis lipoprotein